MSDLLVYTASAMSVCNLERTYEGHSPMECLHACAIPYVLTLSDVRTAFVSAAI